MMASFNPKDWVNMQWPHLIIDWQAGEKQGGEPHVGSARIIGLDVKTTKSWGWDRDALDRMIGAENMIQADTECFIANGGANAVLCHTRFLTGYRSNSYNLHAYRVGKFSPCEIETNLFNGYITQVCSVDVARAVMDTYEWRRECVVGALGDIRVETFGTLEMHHANIKRETAWAKADALAIKVGGAGR